VSGRKLRAALIGGPQYDQVDEALAAYTAEHGIGVEVVFRGDHVALNEHLAQALPGSARYDLVSTHAKYVSSQAGWLQPIDPWLDFVDAGTFHPTALDLCRIGGSLLCLPRNIDARLLMAWTDALPTPSWEPASWADLAAVARSVANSSRAGFAFPARDSGLCGTYYELVASGELSGDDAMRWLADLASHAGPASMVEDGWYFDEVSAAFVAGTVAMVGDWPGYWGRYPRTLKDEISVLRFPPGVDGRRRVYAGCHAWAIPADAPDPIASATLLRHLSSATAARADAAAGMVPVRLDVPMPADHPLDVRRAELLQLTIVDDLLTFPSVPDHPQIETAAADAIRSALRGQVPFDQAAALARPAVAHLFTPSPDPTKESSA